MRKAVNFDEAVKQAKSANNLNLFFQAGYPSIVHKQADLTKCVQCKIGVFVGTGGRLERRRNKKCPVQRFYACRTGQYYFKS